MSTYVCTHVHIHTYINKYIHLSIACSSARQYGVGDLVGTWKWHDVSCFLGWWCDFFTSTMLICVISPSECMRHVLTSPCVISWGVKYHISCEPVTVTKAIIPSTSTRVHCPAIAFNHLGSMCIWMMTLHAAFSIVVSTTRPSMTSVSNCEQKKVRHVRGCEIYLQHGCKKFWPRKRISKPVRMWA